MWGEEAAEEPEGEETEPGHPEDPRDRTPGEEAEAAAPLLEPGPEEAGRRPS